MGIETVNLYSAFVALAVLLLRDRGEIVAIIPRSFCNGPYYRPFRRFLLNRCSLDRIHVFESRTNAFKDDDVLQENVIIKLVRGKAQDDVIVSYSHDQSLKDYRQRTIRFEEIVKPDDPEEFVHVPTHVQRSHAGAEHFESSLSDIGVEVCTGPVVDFRVRSHWMAEAAPNAIPLIYPHHFSTGDLEYPKRHKKPNGLTYDPVVEPWLMPNECYVLIKRFSSKEERRRVVAYVYEPGKIGFPRVGFENHWNVLHVGKRGLPVELARGLACFLNTTILDERFRAFSGHTQVNATDLRNMKYPSVEFLIALGEQYHNGLSQAEIDALFSNAG